MKFFSSFFVGSLLAATVLLGQTESSKIIPVSVWPRVLNLADKQVINPSIDQCVKVGYRLLGAEPVTPQGKQVATRTIIQDPDDPTKAKIVCTYEDKPAPEILTNVPADKVTFNFTTNGVFRGMVWADAPKTNGVK